MRRKMPIGIEDFRELIEEKYCFVDKTDFIRQLIDKHSRVMLITRPRRFGKTLTLSMLDWFFNIHKEKKSRHLFKGLAVERAGADYLQHRGKYPVLFLTLKEIRNEGWQDWPRMLQFIKLYLSQLYANYDYLCDETRVKPKQLLIFDHIYHMNATNDELAMGLSNLIAMMRQYYGKSVILLLDEYDVPIQQAWEKGYYEGCIGFMRQFLGSALKGNMDLDFAVLTGVLRVAKESIFSGLNNFVICSVMEEKYSEFFGFTAEEVRQMLTNLQLQDKLSELQAWYDGYHIGNQEIYNPWSVLNYLDNNCKAKAYWANTSANAILSLLLKGADTLQISMLQHLLQGKSVNVTLNENVIYPNIGQDKAALFTILLTTGYLTIEREISIADARYALRIPNQEIRRLYSTEILSSLTTENSRNPFDNLFEYLLDGETEFFSWQLQEILARYVSIYDTANKESFYHGFMLGMTALFLNSSYQVESNRESGYGRFDLAIFPKDANKYGVIMEFKVAANEAELQKKAEEARQQIEDREYIKEFAKRGISNVWKYGIAFCGKKISVVS